MWPILFLASGIIVSMNDPWRYALFTLLWVGIIYGLNCLIARKWLRIKFSHALAYASAVAVIGVFGEIFLDNVYKFVVGKPLWWYNLLPIHHGYTSAYAVVVWGMFGFHCYLFHHTLKERWGITRRRTLAAIISLEALVLEAALTLSAVPMFGTLLYYYTPNDLWHITSVQNIPFYYVCGLLITTTTRHIVHSPRYTIAASVFLLSVIVLCS